MNGGSAKRGASLDRRASARLHSTVSHLTFVDEEGGLVDQLVGVVFIRNLVLHRFSLYEVVGRARKDPVGLDKASAKRFLGLLHTYLSHTLGDEEAAGGRRHGLIRHSGCLGIIPLFIL